MDLSEYAEHILATADRPLFDEAVKAAGAGALRSAYIMLWLSCAESLKRRFRQAMKWDGRAGKIFGQIAAKEKEHKAIDRYLLDQAREYGFLPGSAHLILSHIYEMRCVYGHPYEEAPSEEQVSHAVASLVEHLLSKPVKLREGFANGILRHMIDEPTYLDDHQPAVTDYSKEILQRIDESVYDWLLGNYWDSLETLASDPSARVFFNRGVWFSQTLLREHGFSCFTHEKWHETVGKHARVCMRVFQDASLYDCLPERAQDSLIGALILDSKTHPSVLRIAEELQDSSVLTTRQRARFSKCLAENSVIDDAMTRFGAEWIRSTGLKLTTLYPLLIKSLESHSWYIQNPVCDLVAEQSLESIKPLAPEQQEELGRNILQAAEGDSVSAIALIQELEQKTALWPKALVCGLLLECFVNEDGEVRFKGEHLDKVLKIIGGMSDRDELVARVASDIDDGQMKWSWIDKNDFDVIIDKLSSHDWTAKLQTSLANKRDSSCEEENR